MHRQTQRVVRLWPRLILSVALTAIGASAAYSGSAAHAASSNPALQWSMFGQNLANTAYSAAETNLSTTTVKSLKPKWIFTTGGDVSARAAVVNGVVYFPDWGGNLWAVNSSTGKLIWSTQIRNYFTASDAQYFANDTLPAKIVSRTSPAVVGNTLYLGTQTGAFLLAINAGTGALIWKTQLDTHPLAIITAAPAVSNNVIYDGVASLEEGAAAKPGYTCCSFRGSAVAVDATTGNIIWKTYMAPPGYTGSSVWGSNPVVDVGRNTVYIGTGNNYSTPTDPTYLSCVSAGGTPSSCLSSQDYVDSVVALDMSTGAVKWSQRLWSSDDWNVACITGDFSGNCPAGSGPDYDFGSAPNEFTIQAANGPETIIGAGQKSGVYSAFNPDTGKLLWATQVGPGSSLGGIEWGSATDGTRIYVAISNLGGQPYTAPSPLAGTGANAGSFAALDAATGSFIWQVPDPNNTVDIGPMAAANGVVYAPSMGGSATAQNMLALDAATGQTLWSYAAGGSVNAGADIVNGTVYWGSGYSNLPIPGFTGNNKFYAFSKGGQ